MNIALSALFLVVLLLPGYLFRRSFYLYRGSESLDATTFPSQILFSLPLAVILHCFAIILVERFSCYHIDIPLAFRVAAAADELSGPEVSDALRHPLLVTLYFGIVISVGYILGLIARIFVKRKKLDIRFEILRYRNSWFYLFTGEEVFIDPLVRNSALERSRDLLAAEISRNPKNTSTRVIKSQAQQYARLSKAIDLGKKDPKQLQKRILKEEPPRLTFIDAVVGLGNQTYLYEGVYSDVEFDGTGEIDRIVLTSVRRRKLDEIATGQVFHEIESDAFVIAYEDVHTLNVRYGQWKLSDQWDKDVF